MGSFYIADGDSFVSTPWTRGPWDPGAQHAGPPSALIGRAIEDVEPRGAMRVARFTLEIFKPIPIAPLSIATEVVRPGKKVQFVTATLRADDTVVARASAWRVRVSSDPLPVIGVSDVPPRGPDGIEAMVLDNRIPEQSYVRAMDWRFARGEFFGGGAAAAWMRMRIPLVGGEEPSPLQRVLVAADSGNGISMELDPTKYIFINTELSVHLFREPVDEWVCLDAVTRTDAAGIGLAESTLWDARGRIGGGRQTLFVSARS